MKRHVALAVTVITFGFVFLLGYAGAVHAQVQKSGKATMQINSMTVYTIQKFPDGVYIAAGSQRGVAYNKAGEGFGNGMGFECAIYLEITDLAKGVFPLIVSGCINRDSDGDAIFTKGTCNQSSYDDWCPEKIVSGTGKYAGITGTIRTKGDGAPYIRRSCLAATKADDCKAYYTSAGSVPVGVTYAIEVHDRSVSEWEWKFP